MRSACAQLYFHAVTSVKFRRALISPDWEDSLYEIMADQFKRMGHTPIVINGVKDHLHLLWRHNRNVSIPDTMQKVKGNGSHWVNQKCLTEQLFRFQGGYGIFSVSRDRVPMVKNYILNQKAHHAQSSLREEYAKILTAHDIPNTDEYHFEKLV